MPTEDARPLPDIFLSYTWKDGGDANKIEDDFRAVGITLRRDVRDVPYRSSIKEFMQRIGTSDFVVMLISDPYLRSENCLYEVTELLSTHQLEKRVLPVLLPGAEGIFNLDGRAIYYDYWKEKLAAVTAQHKAHANADTLDALQKVREINNRLGNFFNSLTDIKGLTLEELKAVNYRPMLDLIGVDDSRVIQEVLAVREIEDLEERELAIESILERFPNNKRALFKRAYLQAELKRFKKARKYYGDLLKLYPNDAASHYNLALLLHKNFGESDAARLHYEEAIRVNPNYSIAHNNLGALLMFHYADYDSAKTHLEKAIKIDPSHARARNALAYLLATHLNQPDDARLQFEEALRLDPTLPLCHLNYALLLHDSFDELPKAKEHYLQAISFDPTIRHQALDAFFGLPPSQP